MSINRSIPAFSQGVSQQPPALRALEQCEVLENGYPTLADGNRKRPPTLWIKKMHSWVPGDNAKVHQYLRGDGEHNIVIVDNGTIRCFDGTTGIEKTVDTTTYPAALTHLGTTNASDNLGMLTVADSTFIWNRSKTCAMKAATIAAQPPRLFIYIKQGVPDVQGGSYSVTLDGSTVTYLPTQTPPMFATPTIAAQLAILINGISGFTATASGSLITVTKAASADFTFSTKDGLGDNGMSALKNRVERYADLPRTFPLEGVTVEVRGQGDDSAKASFWVTYKNDTQHGTGYWEETVAPNVGEKTEIDPATMPVELVREATGNFTLKTVAWNPRLVGSSLTCPEPSFIGGAVSSLFFYRGRLGILSAENVILSRTSSLFNFWPKSSVSVLDTDPIDVTVDGARVANLRHAVAFQRLLMLFSDNTQFPLTGGEVLTPRNVRVDPATEFDCSWRVAPVSSGQDLFFVYEKSSSTEQFRYSGVREYFVNQQASTNDAVDITSHAPRYIPTAVHGASVSSTEDLLLLIAKGQPNAIYFYKYLWDGDKRVQSAWGRWTLRPTDTIYSAHIDRTTVHIVVRRSDGIHLERMELQAAPNSGSLPFQIMLDSLVLSDNAASAPVYFPATNETAFICNLNLTAVPDGVLQAIAGDDQPAGKGALLKITRVVGPAVYVRGKWDTGHVVFGIQYAHRLTLSQILLRDKDGIAVMDGRLQLKDLIVNFTNAVSFRCEVETPGRDTAVHQYQAMMLGIIGSALGTPVIRSGSARFPISSDAKRARITLVNDTPYPANFYSAEWSGLFTTRNPRR